MDAGGSTWGTRDDPGTPPRGRVHLRHRPAHRPRPQDGAQVHCPRPGGAGLQPTPAAAAADRRLCVLPARARRGLPGADRAAAVARGPRPRLHRRLHERHGVPARRPTRGGARLRAPFRDATGAAGPGGLRALPHRVRRRPGADARRLAVLSGAGPLAADLGALRGPPGPADRAPVPRGGLRGLGRRAGRDPARPHAHRGQRRGRQRRRAVQRDLARAGPPLRLRPRRVPALPGQDQGQGGAPIPLHPRGLLPRPQLPRPRRPQRPVPAVAGRGRQHAHPRHHAARRRRALRRGKAPSHAVAHGAVPGGAAARPACHPRGHGRRGRQPVLGARADPQARGRGRGARRRGAHLRGRRADRRSPRARGQRRIAAGHRRLPPPANSDTPRQGAPGAPAPGCPGEAVGRRLAGQGLPA